MSRQHCSALYLRHHYLLPTLFSLDLAGVPLRHHYLLSTPVTLDLAGVPLTFCFGTSLPVANTVDKGLEWFHAFFGLFSMIPQFLSNTVHSLTGISEQRGVNIAQQTRDTTTETWIACGEYCICMFVSLTQRFPRKFASRFVVSDWKKEKKRKRRSF